MSSTPKLQKKAGGYARYSTDRQCSIEVQAACIRKYCKDHGYTISDIHMYYDEALTGTNLHRRGFQELVAAAKANEIDVIVLYDLTRGSRDVVDWFSFRKEMRKYGVEVVSVMDRLGDLDNPSDFLTELITVGIGQTHVLTSRAKSIDKVDFLAKQGKFLGGYAPLGYDIVDGQYIINNYEAEAVRTIFTMYASGCSYGDILEALPAGLRGKRGRPIGKNSIFEILRNERYIGTYSWCKRKVKYFSEWAGGEPSDRAVVIPDAIPPIIDDETWKRVKKRMDANKKNRTNHSKPNRKYLLSGLLYCGECGSAITGVTTINKKGIEYKFYTCCNKRRTKQCNAKNIPANDIEPLLVALLTKSVLNGTMIEATADAIISASKSGASMVTVADLKKELATTNKMIMNLTDAIATGLKSPTIITRISELEVQAADLELRIANMRPECNVDRDYLISELSKDMEQLKNDPDCIKELLKKYIVRVNIFDDHVEIHSTADLTKAFEPLGIKVIEGGKGKNAVLTNDVLTTNGCGGRI